MYSENTTLQMLQNCFKCEQTGMHKAVAMRKAVAEELAQHGRYWAAIFKPRLLFERGLRATWVLENVQLLFECSL